MAKRKCEIKVEVCHLNIEVWCDDEHVGMIREIEGVYSAEREYTGTVIVYTDRRYDTSEIAREIEALGLEACNARGC